MDNLPDEKGALDIVAKSGYLKVENEDLSISLEAHNQVNIQPKGNIFGAKIKVEDNGSITPTLTFDTKKLREPKKNIDVDQILDDALEEYWNGQE
jgi:hypothetical protein